MAIPTRTKAQTDPGTNLHSFPAIIIIQILGKGEIERDNSLVGAHSTLFVTPSSLSKLPLKLTNCSVIVFS